MKRKFLLILLLMAALVYPWALKAQTTITLNQNITQTLTAGSTYTFVDSGGANNAYSNSESYTATFTAPGCTITINFTSFTTESGYYDYDYMYIYDGTTSGTQLAYGVTGSSNNTLSTNTNYTASSGTMTITWNSDSSTTAAGWVATITCEVVACPKPTGLAASNVTNNSATLNWNGEAESYNVRYKILTADAPIFSDDFENDLSNWTTVDADGDGFNWASHINTGTGNLTTHSGDGVAYSESYHNNESGSGGTALNPDNWLITPQVQLGGSVFFWAIGQDDGYFEEHFAIYVSTTGNNPINFTQVSEEYIATSEYVKYSADLSEYSGMGYVAIRHFNVSDQFILNIDDFEIYGPSQWVTVNNVSGNNLDITGLTADTDYEFQVLADCGTDGESSWSASATFHTLDDCATPYELNATNLTAASATLNWTGAQEAYNVQYRSVITPTIESETLEGFEDETEFANWQAFGNVTTNTGARFGRLNSATHTGSYGFSFSSYTRADDYNQYLISPLLDDGIYSIDFYYRASSTYTDGETFKVGYSTTGNAVGDFTWSNEYSTNSTNWNHFVDNNVPQGTKYMAIHYYAEYQYDLYIDDITIKGSTPGEYGEWVTKTNVTNPLNITGLAMTTDYEWQVQGVDTECSGGTTNWSTAATFTTPEGYVKPITHYTSPSDGWYLIASPIGQVDPGDVGNMIADPAKNYDLFSFDQTQTNEWQNYKQNHFTTLEPGKGYLYANSSDVTLTFTGSAYTGNGTFPLVYSDDETLNPDSFMHGWNLMGNPYAEAATVDRAYYTLNGDFAYEFVASENDIELVEPMEGVFVHLETSETNPTVTFTPCSQQQSGEGKGSSLILNVNKGGKFVDRAIISFGQGGTLPKFQFDRNHTKVYIPQDGQDYAIVRSEEMGEMPVNFKAENSGTYSLSFSSRNAEFAYLHLIDNMTGKDIDLLQTQSYSFEARTTDYESRFKLVFATGDNSKDDNFAFFSNGSFIINNEGEATLQVIDVTGRILKSASINGCTNVNVNAASGIYMLRLVNGDNVKVQKVVVK